MASLQSYAQNNPPPVESNNQPQGFFSKLFGSGNPDQVNQIKASPQFQQYQQSGGESYIPNIINNVKSNIQEGSTALTNASNGTENPLYAGATIFKDVAGSLFSPISQAIKPIADQTGVSKAFNGIGQSFVNSPLGQGATSELGYLAGGPALGAASDVVQGALDTAGLYGVAETGGNIWEAANRTSTLPPEAGTTATSDVLKSRTADATPSYDKDLIGQNVKTPEGKIAPRVNEGKGLTGSRTITTSASEAEQARELANLKDYPDKGTNLEKSLAVNNGIGAEAENMRAGIRAEDTANPLDTAKVKGEVTTQVKSLLSDSSGRDDFSGTKPEDQAMLKGMNQKLGVATPKEGIDVSNPNEKLPAPRTASERYDVQVQQNLKNFNGTREGLLDLRQANEQAFKANGGKYTYGSDSYNALAEKNANLRDLINQKLAENTKNLDTQASLKRQTNLFRAKDTLEAKAQAEAPNLVGRIFQDHPFLKKVINRGGMRILIDLLGIGAATAFIRKVENGL